MQVLWFVLLVLGSYFFGNISVARILSGLKKDDITKHGSGNPGTMNMIRTFGIKAGLLNLFLDMLKGAIPALVGFLAFRSQGTDMAYVALYTAGLAVIIGHMYPVVYSFKGGKSVACALGVFIVASPIWLVAVFVSAILYLYLFDYGAVFSFIVLTVMTVSQSIRFAGNVPISILLLAIFFLILFAHRTNIFRLLIGKENKVNLKKSLHKMLKKEQPKETRKEKKQKEIG